MKCFSFELRHDHNNSVVCGVVNPGIYCPDKRRIVLGLSDIPEPIEIGVGVEKPVWDGETLMEASVVNDASLAIKLVKPTKEDDDIALMFVTSANTEWVVPIGKDSETRYRHAPVKRFAGTPTRLVRGAFIDRSPGFPGYVFEVERALWIMGVGDAIITKPAGASVTEGRVIRYLGKDQWGCAKVGAARRETTSVVVL